MSSSSDLPLPFYVILFVLFGIGSCAYNDYKCDSKASLMKMEHSWGPIQGCMVNTKKGWRPIEAIRDIDP